MNKLLGCLFALLVAPQILADSVTSTVATDDADFSTVSSGVYLVFGTASDVDVKCAALFAISIPVNANIDSVWLTPKAYGGLSDPIDVQVSFEAALHPTPIVDESDWDSRTKTAHSANVNGLAAWTYETVARFPESPTALVPALQDVADLGAVDTIQVFIVGNDGAGDDNRSVADIATWGSGDAMGVVVWYSIGGGPSTRVSSRRRKVITEN